jgi:hypothetical protein
MRNLLVWTILATLVLGFATPIGAAQPTLSVTSPTESATIQGNDLTVVFETSTINIVPSTVSVADMGKRPEANRADQGHLHLALDALPLVIWYQPAAYTFKNVPSGEHLLKVELVNNDHSSLTPPVIQQVRFRTIADQPVPTSMPNTGAPEPHIALLLLSALGLLVGGWALRRSYT